MLLACGSNNNKTQTPSKSSELSVSGGPSAWDIWEKAKRLQVDVPSAFSIVASSMTTTRVAFDDLSKRAELVAGQSALTSNTEALRLLKQGVATSCDLPRDDSIRSLTISVFQLTKVQLMKSLLLAVQGNLPSAIEALELNFQVAAKLAECQPELMTLMVSQAIMTQSLKQAWVFTNGQPLALDDARKLMSIVQTINLSAEAVHTVLKAGLSTSDYKLLETTTGQAEYLQTFSKMRNVLSQAFAEKRDLALQEHADSTALEALLSKHESLFDFDETQRAIRKSRQQMSRMITSDASGWVQTMRIRGDELLGELERELGSGFQVLDRPATITEELPDSVAAAFLKVSNPLGRLIVAQHLQLEPRAVMRVVEGLPELRASRSVLAAGLAMCTAFQEHQEAPSKIADLVSNELRDDLLIDAYSGETLLFDGDLLRVWSVGKDGTNSKGDDTWLGQTLTFRCQTQAKPTAQALTLPESFGDESSNWIVPRSKMMDMVDQGIRKIGDTDFEVDRTLLDYLLGNPMWVARGARIVPSIRNSKSNGFKLYAIRPSSIYAKIGLMNGDTILSVNGLTLSSPDKAIETYKQVESAKRFTVQLTRRGKPVTIRYTIVE